MIGFGILIFLIGFAVGLSWISYLQWLMPAGSIMTFTGVFFFFKTTNLQEEFARGRNEDFLTYFWNVLVLKIWTFIFMLWMISMNLMLLTRGMIE